MEASDDWVQYAIEKPMVAEPGKVWNYNSGATEILAYIFQKETGQDIDDYGQKYLFAPLRIRPVSYTHLDVYKRQPWSQPSLIRMASTRAEYPSSTE